MSCRRPGEIVIRSLRKEFKAYQRRSDRLKEWLTLGKRQYHKKICVLDDINLTIQPGESFGLIGMNGAGKSTLLKILTGSMACTSGVVEVGGRVAALLELGMGFLPELTGRENVMLNGRLIGLSSEEIIDKIEEVKEFSELGDYFERPVRTYSSGMFVRLGFAVASAVQPDVIIIDEALSVGDAYFQQKCTKRIRQFIDRGVTLLFVSHDPGAVKLLCRRAALLDHGKIMSVGSPSQTLEIYNAVIARSGQEFRLKVGESDDGPTVTSGDRSAEIRQVWIEVEGQRQNAIETGANARIIVEVNFRTTIQDPTVGIMIRDRLGYDVFGVNSSGLGMATGTFKAGDTRRFCLACKLDLGNGDYTVSAAVHKGQNHVEGCFEWADRVLSFKVLPRLDRSFTGVSYLKSQMTIELVDA